MKRRFSFLLCAFAALLLCLILPTQADAATYGVLYYDIKNDQVTITGCKSSASGELVIPATIEGYPVTTIGNYAFKHCGSLTAVTIPDSVTTIGYGAFEYCDRLTSVTIGNSVTTIGEDAFYFCTSLKTVTIPDSVTTIGSSAFSGCKSLTSVTIGNSVTTIGEDAFSCCTSLTSVSIGNCVTAIGYDAFYACSSLTHVYITDPSAWCKIQFGNSDSNPMYYGDNMYILDAEGNAVTEVELDNSVTAIPDMAFNRCYRLTSVTIPDSVTSIGWGAFAYCSSLTSVTIPDSVTTIGVSAFFYCSSLTSVTIPDSVTTIGDSAFYGCTSLTSVTIPDSVTTIGVSAFFGCSSLTSVTIGNSVTTIGERAFYNCTSLTSVTIPDSVTTIGNSAFYNCTNLNTVYYTGNETEWGNLNIGSALNNATIFYNMRYVTFKSWDGIEIETKMIQQDAAVTSSLRPKREADNIYTYSFSGWDQTVCTGDMVVTAQYLATYIDYTVEFLDWNGSILQTDTYHWDDSVTAPADPARLHDGTYYYVFTGWDSSVSDVCDGNKSYTAVYEQITRILPATPDSPILGGKSALTVTLEAVEGCEYSKDGVTWQDSNLFTGLTANTEYIFYQRVKETERNYPSQVSPALRVKTLQKTTCTTRPDKPIVADYSYNKIELVAREGYEYRINDDLWTKNPIFTGLQENTSYTVYQRIAETGERFASGTSAGVVVTTTVSGETSVDYYLLLRQYISRNATSSNGKKLQISESNNYTYSLTNQNDGITFALLKGKTGSSGFDITTHFTISPDSKNINVYCQMTYFSGGTVMDIALDNTILVNRAAYTSNTKLTTKESGFMYITSSELSETATLTMKILCAFWDREIYSDLGFGLDSLGFVSYNGLSDAVCDPASGYHTGTTVIRNQRKAGCVVDGYSGDYYCIACGEKVSSGSSIPSLGYADLGHSFTNYVSDKNATYEADGTKTAKCDRCEETDTIADEGSKLIRNGWFELEKKWYFYENGEPIKNTWRKDSVGWVWLGADGAMLTNAWVRDSVGWCYVGANGYAVTNCWKQDSVGWCYLNSEGSMTKNAWVLDGGKWYFLDGNGYMVSNKWMKDSKGWVWLEGNGAMATNKWVRDSKGWCYVGSDGYAVTNCWKKDSVGWCYLDSEGSMTKNDWVLDGGKWYYCDGNGYMISSCWRKIGSYEYYFHADGHMAANERIQGYWIDGNGHYIPGK